MDEIIRRYNRIDCVKVECHWGDCDTYYLTHDNIEEGYELNLNDLEHSWYIEMNGVVSERKTIMHVENLNQVIDFMNSKKVKIDERRISDNYLIIGVDKDEILLDDLTVISASAKKEKSQEIITNDDEDDGLIF